MNSVKSCLQSGQLNRARELFDKIPYPDLYTLTLLLSAYSTHGLPKQSIALYRKLCKEKDLYPDRYVILSVAKACSLSMDAITAIELHSDAIRFKLSSDLPVGNALVDMFGKCGLIEEAISVFDQLPDKDVISWTSLISAHANCKQSGEALQVFRVMLLSGMKPNSVTLCTVLHVCSAMKAIKFGKEIHGFAVRNRFESDVWVSSGLIDVYAKSFNPHLARHVFDGLPDKDTVSWNVMLSSYFSVGNSEEALELFGKMKSGGLMNCASWNCMISGFAQNGRIIQSIEMFAEMQHSGFRANEITIASVLPACTDVENRRGGKEIHGFIYRYCFIKDKMILTALVLLYAKCGDLMKSRLVFDRMIDKDVVAWNAMIFANSMHGCGEDALCLYYQMIKSGMKPNSMTFMGVLSGCSHSLLVQEGRSIFSSMSCGYGIEQDAEHYSCMVDVLSRAGRLQEAYEFIQGMPMEPKASAWGALLAACRVYKNVELGMISANRLFKIEPENPGNYVLLSNILMNAKLSEDASNIRRLMKDRGVRKAPGRSWIQIKNKVHTFVKGDDNIACRDDIYDFLDKIGEKMKREGYEPDIEFVLQDIRGEEKEESLCSHSERLAVAFGAMHLNGESAIRVFKNLRICGDCHHAIKFMSKILGVGIIVRDKLRFHHFRDGFCSCGDRW
ncbi:pentatricopeptide repeat-containing protein At2g29760, chloroplastic-like [Phalaenopsis equestris]|uniref:pentatricopeptide repeat-containing protein At2g29760, chloroplastic-like n=1 Tax=Phalaenopsis equestris TaxID=78828 RepID=UPI0009E5E8D7|nr:pentatricopeptide repeat-containing protein At2g29760, chloroplastic-like [Phalaenopsis equestris]